MSDIRVRLAPSPTGDVHIGTIWLAQFNWLFARQQAGKFILRIEDTDQKRLVAGSVEKIYDALKWYGLEPDEGPEHGGEVGPYVQSKRLSLYRQAVDQLLKQGSAYYCFCSAARLDELRTAQQAAKLPPRYDKRCATLDPKASQARVEAGETAVIRLNVPQTGTITLRDMIRGEVTFRLDQVDDSVLLKSDGFPTYHLAVVVDDHAMNISHIIRGEEWLSSAPKHLLLYQHFGWEPPHFAHLPLILGEHKRKLSKREGAASALSFRDRGYLLEAMQNFLALMGWHPKGDEEVLPRDEILKQFSLADVNPSGAVFDQAKLDWLNGVYIRRLPLSELRHRLEPFWHRPTNPDYTDAWLDQALGLVHDRLVTLADIDQAINFVFAETWDEEVKDFNAEMLVGKGQTRDTARQHLKQMSDWLSDLPELWSAEKLKTTILENISSVGLKNGPVLWPVRVALSLRSASPDVFDLLALLGKTESLRRITQLAS